MIRDHFGAWTPYDDLAMRDGGRYQCPECLVHENDVLIPNIKLDHDDRVPYAYPLWSKPLIMPISLPIYPTHALHLTPLNPGRSIIFSVFHSTGLIDWVDRQHVIVRVNGGGFFQVLGTFQI